MINTEKPAVIINSSPASANKLIADLEKLEILKEVTGAQRGKVYVFDQYIKLFR